MSRYIKFSDPGWIAENKPKSPLPPDPEEQNYNRANWAQAALEAFQKETRTDAPDACSDLLADLMHFCDRYGLDFDSELARAKMHYEEETADHLPA